MGKKLIAFSLWGPHKLYNVGAIENIREAKEVYPGWTCRFYVADNSPVLSTLQGMDCEVVPMSMESGYIPAYWRFYAASDHDVDVVLFRDCDSRVNTREAAAVNDWLTNTTQVAHLMKDWPAPHITEIMLAGMWGIRGGVIPNMRELVAQWVKHDDIWNKYTDQDFLRAIVFPLIKHSLWNHGVYSPAGESVPFPPHPPMKYGTYVGQPIPVE